MKNLPGIEKWSKLEHGKFEPYMSASKLNLFKNDLPMFICKYGYGKGSGGSPAMHRGLIVEDAVVRVLQKKMSVDESIEKAAARFGSLYLVPDEAVHKEFLNLDPMIRLSCEALADYGVPEFPENGKQEKVEFTMKDTINNWEIPFIGFLDLVFPETGNIVDLKTTTKMPSTQSFDHQLQRAIYQKAKGNFDVQFLYVTPKRYDWLADGNPDELLESARGIVNHMNSFCNNLTPEQARKSIPLNDNYLNFYWKNENELKGFYRQEGTDGNS
tara:strand:+ start:187 stop:999 length:813 start_codon:yes stop_codon:yes gene_type:complete